MPLTPDEARPVVSADWVTCWACSQTGAIPRVTRAATNAVSAEGLGPLEASGAGGKALRDTGDAAVSGTGDEPFPDAGDARGSGRNVSRALGGPAASGAVGVSTRAGTDGRGETTPEEGASECGVRRSDVEADSGSERRRRRTTRGPCSLRTRAGASGGGGETTDGSGPAPS